MVGSAKLGDRGGRRGVDEKERVKGFGVVELTRDMARMSGMSR